METIAENRRARFDYEISETIDAGIELRGFEVKSAKAGRLNLAGSRVIIKQNEAWLLNSQIPPYQPNNTPKDYDQGRSRRLLLRKEEIKSLIGRLKSKSAFLIPLRAYVKNNLIKIELGLGRVRKKSDKREVLKKRAAEREMRAPEK
jgi:SsrA-binding protein